MADGWMSTSDSARCTDDVTDGNGWKKITGQGQIDVSKPNRALQVDNQTEAGFTSFSSLSGSGVRAVDFWIKIDDDVDNGTIVGWGDTRPQAVSRDRLGNGKVRVS